MKFAIAILVLNFIVVSQCGSEFMQKMMGEFEGSAKKCMAKLNITPDEMKNSWSKEITTENSCPCACILKDVKLMNDDNTLNMDEFEKYTIHMDENTKNGFINCKKEEQADKDECVAAANMKRCWMKFLA